MICVSPVPTGTCPYGLNTGTQPAATGDTDITDIKAATFYRFLDSGQGLYTYIYIHIYAAPVGVRLARDGAVPLSLTPLIFLSCVAYGAGAVCVFIHTHTHM